MTSLTKIGTPARLPSAAPGGRRRKPPTELKIALVFLAPALIGFIAFYLVPTIRGLYLSFTDYSLLGDPNWIGLKNYIAIFQDQMFWNAMGVTLEYVFLNIGFQTIIALVLAVLMHTVAKNIVVRASLLLPYLIANVIVALLWFWMLDYQIGIINQLLEWIGLPRIAFFGNQAWAIPTIAFVNVWRNMGYTALLIFAGLQAIPGHVYEAAAIDGASAWKAFWRVTMPLLRPVLVLVMVVTVTGSFQIFDTVAVTTKGGPVNASRVIQYYIYDKAFNQLDFGYASALSVILFIILGIVAVVQLKVLRGNQNDLD